MLFHLFTSEWWFSDGYQCSVISPMQETSCLHGGCSWNGKTYRKMPCLRGSASKHVLNCWWRERHALWHLTCGSNILNAKITAIMLQQLLGAWLIGIWHGACVSMSLHSVSPRLLGISIALAGLTGALTLMSVNWTFCFDIPLAVVLFRPCFPPLRAWQTCCVFERRLCKPAVELVIA